MPEEIADLTGKRIEDTAYANNVIFNTDGLNELLENIKNYPIVDIDYVAEGAEDNGKPIWETYTSGTPCIKVIYGDENSQAGNVSDEDLERIRDAQKRISLYNNVRNLYDKYGSLEQEYLTLISNVQQELKRIIINVCNTYNKYLTFDGTNWSGSYYDLFNANGASGLNNFHTYIYNDTDGAKGLYYKITFSVNDIIENLLEDIINNNDLQNAFYTISYGTRNNSTINPSVTVNTEEYYVIPLMGEISGATISNITWTGEDINRYLGGSWENDIGALRDKVKQYNNLLQQTIDLLSSGGDTNHVQQLLNIYAGYIRNARVQQMEAIRQYLYVKNGITANALKNEVTEYSMEDETSYKNVYDYVMQNYINGSIQDDENLIASILANAVDSKYTLLSTHTANNYNSDTEYYILDNGQYKKANFNTTASFVNYDGNIYTLNSGAIPAIYGYKYVKVGSNIVFPQIGSTDAIAETTAAASSQKYGSFRVVINNHTYEVPIKGFEESGNSNILVNTNFRPDDDNSRNLGFSSARWKNIYATSLSATNDGVVTVGITSSTATLAPASSSDSSLGTSGEPWDNAYITSITATTVVPSTSGAGSVGTANTHYGAGYFDQLTIGTVTIGGTGGTGDTDKYLRSDGTWNNILSSNGIPYYSLQNQKLTKGTVPTSTTSAGTILFLSNNFAHSTSANSSATISNTFRDSFGAISTYVNSSNVTILNLRAYENALETSGTTQSGTNNYTALLVQYDSNASGDTGAFAEYKQRIYTTAVLSATKVYNAVFNDYAEYRRTCLEAKPGMCVVDNDDGTMRVSDGYLLPGAQIVSDTFGHAMGMTEECTTPVAVAGRVLAYPYQDRKNYHAGMAVCAAPGGKVNIMSRKDIREYPDCIVGIVSEIPDYEYWGTDNVKVDGRIWIKVR